MEDPSISLNSLRDMLLHYPGIYVGRETISHFFLHDFPLRGSMMRKPNLVPFDKFHLDNVDRLVEYVNFIVQINPSQLKNW